MHFPKKSAAAFQRIAARAKRADLHAVMMDDQGRLCVSDGCILIRLFFEADLYPDGLPAPLPRLPVSLERAADQAFNAADALVASASRADFHGDAPVLPDNIRQFASFAKKQGYKYPLYPMGRAYVNPSLLADVLDVVPDAVFYADPKNSLQPLYFQGSRADGVLCPIRPDIGRIPAALELLATWRGEKTPLADELRAAEETKKDYADYCARLAALQAERAEKLRQQNAEMEAERRQQEEAAAAQEAEKAREHAEALADLHRKLQTRRDAEISIDGELLAELMDVCGVSVPGRVKGWIREKLRAVTISAEGHMCAYRFARTRKGERGSDAVYTYVDILLEKLASADTSDVPSTSATVQDVPELENQTQKVASAIPPVQDIAMPAFRARFAEEYERLYACRGNVSGYSEAVSAFESACEDETFLAFVRRFVQERDGDPVSSDRECAAFMFTLAAFRNGQPSSEPVQNVPESQNQPSNLESAACHMVYCTGPNPLGEQNTIDFPSLAACREWIVTHRSADLARSCGYTVYAGRTSDDLRDNDGFPVVLFGAAGTG